jgi:hypothetical protein
VVCGVWCVVCFCAFAALSPWRLCRSPPTLERPPSVAHDATGLPPAGQTLLHARWGRTQPPLPPHAAGESGTAARHSAGAEAPSLDPGFRAGAMLRATRGAWKQKWKLDWKQARKGKRALANIKRLILHYFYANSFRYEYFFYIWFLLVLNFVNIFHQMKK